MAVTSSGGVICRRAEGGEPEIVLVGQSHSGRWGLPKGAPSEGETLEQAALREVREETGMEGHIVASLGYIEYWFGVHGARFHKTVHFYLMQAIGGDTSRHDHEHDRVAWFPLSRAYEVMSYANERDILRRAQDVLLNNT